MIRDLLFQRVSTVKSFQRAMTNAVNICFVLFASKEFFYSYMNIYFKRALFNMSVDAILYDMSNIFCANDCKTLFKIRHIHQKKNEMTFQFIRSCFIKIWF